MDVECGGEGAGGDDFASGRRFKTGLARDDVCEERQRQARMIERIGADTATPAVV